LRDELRKMLGQWDTKLALTRKGDQAHLLDMLQSLPPSLQSASPGARHGAQRRRTSRRTMKKAHSRSRRIEQ
jgi:hypothetical protein